MLDIDQKTKEVAVKTVADHYATALIEEDIASLNPESEAYAAAKENATKFRDCLIALFPALTGDPAKDLRNALRGYYDSPNEAISRAAVSLSIRAKELIDLPTLEIGLPPLAKMSDDEKKKYTRRYWLKQRAKENATEKREAVREGRIRAQGALASWTPFGFLRD